MRINAIQFKLLTACLVGIMLATPGLTQEPPAQPDELIGIIPGTSMTRDEFRARANAQLSAIALNAEAFRLVHGEYPDSFYALYNSSAWNIDPKNMFTGDPLDSIAFAPQPTDLTASPRTDLPLGMQAPPVSGNPVPSLPPVGDDGQGEGQDVPQAPVSFVPGQQGALRVDPGKVSNITHGDIFFRKSDDTLQLVMYAPDNTYHEVYHDSPNQYWQKHMAAEAIGKHWPDDAYAGQIIFFTERMLPQFYNLTMFMADLEVLPGSALDKYGVEARIQMAEALDITILNPYSKQPIRLMSDYSVGDFVEPNPGTPVPIFLCLRGKRILNLDQLLEDQRSAARASKQGKKARNPRRPAMGGSR